MGIGVLAYAPSSGPFVSFVSIRAIRVCRTVRKQDAAPEVPMRRLHLTVLCWAMAGLAVTPAARAQRFRQPPRVGYVYPAGGQQGQTIDVTVGGQFFANASNVTIAGEGIAAEVTEYHRPLRGKELTTIRDVFQKARQKAREQNKGKWPSRLAILRHIREMARQKGITDQQIAAFNEFRRRRSDPKYQLNPQLSESLTVRITIADDAAPGPRELRVTTPRGVSNPLRFHVGILTEVRESEPNDKAPAGTQVAEIPVVLNGQIMPGDVDCFRFTARRGQRLVAAVSARELVPYLADAVPGWFQATIALHDAHGREVAYADDFRFDPDPVLHGTIPADGDYVLTIADAIYRGREDFVYRIAIGELPFVTGVFPLGARHGETVDLAVDGWNLTPGQSALSVAAEQRGLRPQRIDGTAGACDPVPFAVDELPECVEAEPNSDAAHAATVAMPVIVNGRIDTPGDRDVFRFRAAKGDRLVAEVTARRLGSPLDSRLTLTDAAGRELAANDDCEDKACGLLTHHADSYLSVTIPADNDYLLSVADTRGHGGSAYAYRLRIGPPRPDFELRVVPSAINAAGGTCVPITVYAVRRDGFDGPIDLRLTGAPRGFAVHGRVPAGADRARATLSVPGRPPQKLTPLRLEGVATVRAASGGAPGRELRRLAVPADDMMQAFIYRHLVPAERWIAAVSTTRWGGPQWTVRPAGLVRLAPGGTARIEVTTRARGSRSQLRLSLDDPPAGLSIQRVTPTRTGVAVVLRADPSKATPGAAGNLILDAFLQRRPPTTAPAARGRPARVPMGCLPAIPFEIAPQTP